MIAQSLHTEVVPGRPTGVKHRSVFLFRYFNLLTVDYKDTYLVKESASELGEPREVLRARPIGKEAAK